MFLFSNDEILEKNTFKERKKKKQSKEKRNKMRKKKT